MPTVSDLLAIQISIDDAGVERGGDEAVQEIDRVRARIKQQADDIERLAKNIGEGVVTSLRYLAGLMGVVLSFEGFRQMVVEVANAGTSLGRFSEAVEVSAGRVGALEQALERVGGRADDVRPVLAAMRSDLTTMRMGGPWAEWVKTAGLAPLGISREYIERHSVEETLLEISRRAGAAHMTAFQLKALLPGLPLSTETLQVLTNPLQRQLREIREMGTAPTPEQIGAAERLKEKIATLGQLSDATLRDVITLTEPLITSVLRWVKTALEWLDGVERALIGSKPEPAAAAAPAYAPRRFGERPWSRPGRPEAPGAAPAPGAPAMPAAPGGAGTDAGAGAGLSGSSYLKARRQRFSKELERDPQLKETLAAVVSLEHESDPVPVVESLMNRMDYADGTIRSGIYGGRGGSFYGPVRRGLVPGRLAELKRNPERLRRIMHAIDQAIAGSNLIKGATDQGSMGDPNAQWPGGRIIRYGEIYNDWGGGPGGHTGARLFRESQQRAIERGPATAPSPQSLLRVPNVNTGAGAALRTTQPVNQNITNETSAVINHVTVNTNATNAAGIAADVKDEVARQLAVPQLEKAQ